MKGLALILSPKGSKPGAKPGLPSMEKEEEPEAEGDEAGGSEKEFARLAAEAIGDGDYDAAADALVSLVKACSSYSK